MAISSLFYANFFSKVRFYFSVKIYKYVNSKGQATIGLGSCEVERRKNDRTWTPKKVGMKTHEIDLL